ncbi:MAG: DUF3662 and FHA domain-containing protein [Raoultibacter sp.]
MGFFSKFEGRIEDTFEGVADKMFDAPISPVQIAKKAEKMMRREKMVGAGKQFAPTLYTVLVNPDDDQRLFGYYPTLAGETETYLAAKAANEGLVMDGQPLVRFIVDDDLRHGKFDIIAEPVAAPIIAQLRAEEMHRYGLGAAPAPIRGGAPGYQTPRPQAPQPQQYGNDYGAPVGDPFAPQSRANQYAQADPYGQGFGEPQSKAPLPYVPEDELDYSIDYGEYTFDSQDFDDYNENGVSPRPISQSNRQHDSYDAYGQDDYDTYDDYGDRRGYDNHAAPSAPFDEFAGSNAGIMGGVAGAGFAGAAAGAAGAYGAGAPDTVVFAAGSGNAAPMPNAHAVRARLINMNDDRPYDLATARLVLGRDRTNDIVVDDINASRTHAELRFEPQGVWVITDLGSTNGTYVNGAEITSQPLQGGDRITIGMTNYAFSLS